MGTGRGQAQLKGSHCDVRAKSRSFDLPREAPNLYYRIKSLIQNREKKVLNVGFFIF